MNRQSGFTLFELVIAIALFALLGLAGWRLFDTVVRTQQGAGQHERDIRALQRAVGVIERDVWQAVAGSVVLAPGQLQLQRSHWRNPLDQPRSERQMVSYRLEDAALWRDSFGEGAATVQRQKLLDDVRSLSWRLFDPQRGWHGETAGDDWPLALELNVSAGRFEQIRRVLLLPGVLP
ncbi:MULTISPECIES: type II secretion system protein GspJ [unclassified Pseudomonas]|uniref:type II secretion system protein GspJ n=1 Tax=unclassified Pseudomonas TaxID=196821 RepID=UPI00119AED27|nr:MULTISPECIES: type II secretion system protein GspJ [unclassified Pseudomonas]TWC16490.1 general secretion pathway protein J [Pseudomonas sp. SJZ075]TWC24187.1 general secretion pathway protein J [Pseudomonas sp. SJZ074]TWC32540.1 general secretion pathway protein J [Pseudomonas sp. SJZ078]TWC41926.1 general secretion pathway protein J [Pseudomonas sp. SJZ085]TWC53624.1 general secretion pathway protein J [Pseudomonas sp. SJZ124]